MRTPVPHHPLPAAAEADERTHGSPMPALFLLAGISLGFYALVALAVLA
jgi:hypothetical protein